jgi:hypothetical protein
MYRDGPGWWSLVGLVVIVVLDGVRIMGKVMIGGVTFATDEGRE